MPLLSVLDLVPVLEGHTVADALKRAPELAAHVESLGYHRYWVAEHHGMPAIASAATSVVLAHVGPSTSRIRIGAGGIMLPNHSPLVIAEQFGTLETLFPGRVDLGLGRAAGADQRVARALRRNANAHPDDFPRDVLELQAFLAGDPELPITAIPGAGTNVPLWILGSSLYGAQLAAAFGLPYAFASHFAPQMLDQAIAIYRERFQPSEALKAPRVMAALNVVAAESDEEAKFLFTSQQQAVLALRTTGPAPMPAPVEGFYEGLPPPAQHMVDQFLECSAVGSPGTVKAGLERFAERTGADEVIVTGRIFDFEKQKRSFALLAEVAKSIA